MILQPVNTSHEVDAALGNSRDDEGVKGLGDLIGAGDDGEETIFTVDQDLACTAAVFFGVLA